ncbi:hypothetical protein BS17DRAFT_711091, partial [Gyrodon lividus]
GDTEAALQAIEPLERDAKTRSGLKICISLCLPEIPQLEEVEAQLMETVDTLKSRNHIFGTPPTLLELLDPPEEKEIRQGPLLEANRSDEAIMDAVHQEMAASKHDVIEVESDDEDDPADPPITHANVMVMCQLLEPRNMVMSRRSLLCHIIFINFVVSSDARSFLVLNRPR